MLPNLYTGKCSEDKIFREGCKLQGLRAQFSSSMHTSWVRFQDVVGVMRKDFFKGLKGDQQGLQLEAVQCAVSRCDSFIDLNSRQMELSWFKYSPPCSSLLVVFGPRVGPGLHVLFLQDARGAFEAAEISVYVDWDLSNPELKMIPM